MFFIILSTSLTETYLRLNANFLFSTLITILLIHNGVSKRVLNEECKQGWSLFKKREHSLIFSALKKSCFLKSMLLLNFPIRWYLNTLNMFEYFYDVIKNIDSMILIRCYYLVSYNSCTKINDPRKLEHLTFRSTIFDSKKEDTTKVFGIVTLPIFCQRKLS